MSDTTKQPVASDEVSRLDSTSLKKDTKSSTKKIKKIKIFDNTTDKGE